MAKTSYVDILPGTETQFFTGIRRDDRFVFSKLAKKLVFFSVKKKKGLTQRSMLPQVAALWAGLSDAQKLDWKAAGAECNLNGWRLFVQDTCARIVNEMPGAATPSLLHQSWVGNIHIEAPASEAKIIQIHPHFYWVSKKVTGKKGMYEPVLVTEDLALSFKISLNYSSNLAVINGSPFAKFYVRFWHSYQGADQYSDFIIPLDFDTSGEEPDGWKKAEATISLFGVDNFGNIMCGSESELLGYYIRYDLYLWISGLTGDLYFDNIKVEHSGQNWARDPFCKDVNQGFTRAFYQIPKHWAGVILPDGAWFESIYKDF